MKVKKTDKRVSRQTSLLSLLRIIFIALWSIVISLIGNYFFNRKSKAEASRIYQKLGRYWAAIILAFCNVQVKVIGLENIKNKRGVILTPNHMSHFDILVLFVALQGPNFRFVYKKELSEKDENGKYRYGIFGKVFAQSDNIPVNREHPGSSTMKLIVQRLRDGLNLIMFPEGTSGYENEILPFQDSPFRLAAKLETEIVPVVIKGTHEVYNKLHPRLINSEFINSKEVSVEFFPGIKVEKDKIEEMAKKIHDFMELKYWEV